MQSITNLTNLRKFNNEQLDKKNHQKEQAAKMIDKLFIQLKAACPAMFHTLNHDDEITVKKQWVIGFTENLINPAMINLGMKVARRQKNPFMPSVGQFIEWCEIGLVEQYGLPTSIDLVKKLTEYCARRGFDDFYNFDYGSDANYWLIIDLYQAMQNENLDRIRLVEQASKLITDMAKKMMLGYVPPAPKNSLPKTASNKKRLSREESLSKIHEIRRKFGFNYTPQQTSLK